MAIKILVDSASDININEAMEMDIELLPMQITFNNIDYFDGVDLLPRQFYEKLIESDTLPKTSQINPFRFSEAFERLVNEGHEVIAIVLSSKLSNTFNNALQASQEFEGKVFVVDSLSATAGERLLVEYALRLIKEGKTAKEIYEELMEKRHKIQIMALLNTLEYLKKGGRISSAVSFAGELLSLKPVISIVDGEVKLIGKARGSKNGNNLINKLVEEKGVDFSMPYCALYSGTNDELLQKYIKDSTPIYASKIKKLPIYMLGSTIGTHIGPGAIGVVFFSEK